MSYSFTARGQTKAALKDAIAAEFAKVEAAQPVHRHDRVQAEMAAGSLIDLVPEAEEKDFTASCNGWVATMNDQVIGVSISVSVNHATRV